MLVRCLLLFRYIFVFNCNSLSILIKSPHLCNKVAQVTLGRGVKHCQGCNGCRVFQFEPRKIFTQTTRQQINMKNRKNVNNRKKPEFF